jgi:hypothetical protein
VTRAALMGRVLALPLIIAAGIAGAWLAVRQAPASGPRVSDALRPLAEVATARVELRSIQRGRSDTPGLFTDNRDEVLVAAVLTGDLGIPLADLTPDRWRLVEGTLEIRLPPPRLLSPGLVLDPVESRELEVRTTRWAWTRPVSDPGLGQAAARAAALAQAVTQAPQVLTRLGLEQDLRATTRRTVEHLLPALLGRPGLTVVVRFDDEPQGAG